MTCAAAGTALSDSRDPNPSLRPHCYSIRIVTYYESIVCGSFPGLGFVTFATSFGLRGTSNVKQGGPAEVSARTVHPDARWRCDGRAIRETVPDEWQY